MAKIFMADKASKIDYLLVCNSLEIKECPRGPELEVKYRGLDTCEELHLTGQIPTAQISSQNLVRTEQIPFQEEHHLSSTAQISSEEEYHHYTSRVTCSQYITSLKEIKSFTLVKMNSGDISLEVGEQILGALGMNLTEK